MPESNLSRSWNNIRYKPTLITCPLCRQTAETVRQSRRKGLTKRKICYSLCMSVCCFFYFLLDDLCERDRVTHHCSKCGVCLGDFATSPTIGPCGGLCCCDTSYFAAEGEFQPQPYIANALGLPLDDIPTDRFSSPLGPPRMHPGKFQPGPDKLHDPYTVILSDDGDGNWQGTLSAKNVPHLYKAEMSIPRWDDGREDTVPRILALSVSRESPGHPEALVGSCTNRYDRNRPQSYLKVQMVGEELFVLDSLADDGHPRLRTFQGKGGWLVWTTKKKMRGLLLDVYGRACAEVQPGSKPGQIKISIAREVVGEPEVMDEVIVTALLKMVCMIEAKERRTHEKYIPDTEEWRNNR